MWEYLQCLHLNEFFLWKAARKRKRHLNALIFLCGSRVVIEIDLNIFKTQEHSVALAQVRYYFYTVSLIFQWQHEKKITTTDPSRQHFKLNSLINYTRKCTVNNELFNSCPVTSLLCTGFTTILFFP